MASIKKTPSFSTSDDSPVVSRRAEVVQDWSVSSSDDRPIKTSAIASLIRPDSSASSTASTKGIQIMLRAQSSHPLDPLSSAEISVAVATVRAAGATPEVRDGMRFVEVVLSEPSKNIVALADAYFFPPFQPSLLPRTKGGAVIPSKLPPRRARLVVYNKKSNETSIWIVELSEVHAATRGGHHRGKLFGQVPESLLLLICLQYFMFFTQSAYAKYVKEYYVKSFGVSTRTYNQKYLKETSNDDRLWWLQVCIEVAYFQIAPANDSIRSSKVNTENMCILVSSTLLLTRKGL